MKEKVQRKHQKKQASLPVRETVKVNLGRVRSQFDQLLNVRSIDDLVPRTLKETPEEVALSSWFSSMILCEKDAQYARGFLHYLLPVYTSAKNDSALCLATSALAMLIAGGRPRFRAFFNMGRAYFGDALRLTSKALQHPIDSKSDETLMAVLVLGMGEVSFTLRLGFATALTHHPNSVHLIWSSLDSGRLVTLEIFVSHIIYIYDSFSSFCGAHQSGISVACASD